jgi:tRNA(fMet)-specific endonuclease VapC
MNRCLLDTDIFSEILKGKNTSVVSRSEEYLRLHKQFSISIPSVFEIVLGLHAVKREDVLQETLLFIAQQEVVSLDISSTILAGRIAADLKLAGKTIGNADPMIAAIAITSNFTLVSGNTDHFSRIIDIGYPLVLDNWK